MEKKTIYAIVRIDNNKVKLEDNWAVYVYSDQTSNKERLTEKLNAYKAKYPTYRWYLVSRERAAEIKKEYRQRLKALEAARMEKCEKNLNKLMTGMVYRDSIQRKK